MISSSTPTRCEHAVFEIMSNAIDEARAGYGMEIQVTRFADGSFQVEDQGRGCPVVLVAESKQNAGVHHSLTFHDVQKILCWDGDVGENLQVGQPADGCDGTLPQLLLAGAWRVPG